MSASDESAAQSEVVNTVNLAVSNAILEESLVKGTDASNKCSASLIQAFSLNLGGRSQIRTSRDFLIQQNAKIAFSCMLKEGLIDVKELTNKIVERINAEENLGMTTSTAEAAEIAASEPFQRELRRIVDYRVRQAFDDNCNVSTVSSLQVDLHDSFLSAGSCSRNKIQRLSQECSASAERATAPACAELADCAKKEGDFSIIGGLNVSPSCYSLNTIGVDVALLLQRMLQQKQTQEHGKPGNKGSAAEANEPAAPLPTWATALLISLALVLLISIITVVAVLASKKPVSKKSATKKSVPQKSVTENPVPKESFLGE